MFYILVTDRSFCLNDTITTCKLFVNTQYLAIDKKPLNSLFIYSIQLYTTEGVIDITRLLCYNLITN